MEITELLAGMTVEEKAALCAGSDFWHTAPLKSQKIPPVLMTDGPHGLRKQRGKSDHICLGKSVPATCYPAAVTSACSFDRELLSLEGAALGMEAKAEGVGMVLGPGLNIKRHPLCGRSFEYFSEDPCLAGELGAAFVTGVQSQNVGACLKHFACNNQEAGRMISNSLVDERALREIYLPAFETAVKKAKPMGVMGAYNRLNGVYCCENHALLTDILRREWGFDGLVVTDWGAMNDAAAAVNAGLDLEMPASGGERTRLLADAVKAGRVSMAALDRAAGNVLRFVLAVKDNKPAPYDDDEHHETARRIARESGVLLKNNGLLPLSADARIAVLNGFGASLRYQGAGSSRICPTQLTAPEQALAERGVRFLLCDSTNRDSAFVAAKAAEAVVVFAGLPDEAESEGFDRKTLCLPDEQNELVELALSANPNTVVVLLGGGAMELPWLDRAAAVLYMGLGGQAVAGAAVDLLFGDETPSGHLAETWPLRLADCPAASCFGAVGAVEYRESVFVGYRYYDTAQKPVLFPFGHGLSYTEFSYSELSFDSAAMTVSCTVANTGSRRGKAVVQLYIAPPKGMVFRPIHELRNFAKLALEPGESQTVVFPLTERDFSFWNTKAHAWSVQDGSYTVQLGASSRDIRLTGSVTLRQPPLDTFNYTAGARAYYELSDDPTFLIPRWQFEFLLGHSVPAAAPQPFGLNSTLSDAQDTALGRFLLRCLKRFTGKGAQAAMMQAMLTEMPLRAFCMGGVKLSAAEKLAARIRRAQERKNGVRDVPAQGSKKRPLLLTAKKQPPESAGEPDDEPADKTPQAPVDSPADTRPPEAPSAAETAPTVAAEPPETE